MCRLLGKAVSQQLPGTCKLILHEAEQIALSVRWSISYGVSLITSLYASGRLLLAGQQGSAGCLWPLFRDCSVSFQIEEFCGHEAPKVFLAIWRFEETVFFHLSHGYRR